MPMNDATPKELIFELSALHDMVILKPIFFWYFS